MAKARLLNMTNRGTCEPSYAWFRTEDEPKVETDIHLLAGFGFRSAVYTLYFCFPYDFINITGYLSILGVPFAAKKRANNTTTRSHQLHVPKQPTPGSTPGTHQVPLLFANRSFGLGDALVSKWPRWPLPSSYSFSHKSKGSVENGDIGYLKGNDSVGDTPFFWLPWLWEEV